MLEIILSSELSTLLESPAPVFILLTLALISTTVLVTAAIHLLDRLKRRRQLRRRIDALLDKSLSYKENP